MTKMGQQLQQQHSNKTRKQLGSSTLSLLKGALIGGGGGAGAGGGCGYDAGKREFSPISVLIPRPAQPFVISHSHSHSQSHSSSACAAPMESLRPRPRPHAAAAQLSHQPIIHRASSSDLPSSSASTSSTPDGSMSPHGASILQMVVVKTNTVQSHPHAQPRESHAASPSSETEQPAAVSSAHEYPAQHNQKGLQAHQAMLSQHASSRELQGAGGWKEDSVKLQKLNLPRKIVLKTKKSSADAFHAHKAPEDSIGSRRGLSYPKRPPNKWDEAGKWLVSAVGASHHPVINSPSATDITTDFGPGESGSPCPVSSSLRLKNCSFSSGEIVGFLPDNQSQAGVAISDSELLSSRVKYDKMKPTLRWYKQQQILLKLRGLRGKGTPLSVRLALGQKLHNDTISDLTELSSKGASMILINGVQSSLQTKQYMQPPEDDRWAALKDAGTEVSPSMSMRDMGTQMTPSTSHGSSKCGSPIEVLSPSRHNTPIRVSSSWMSSTDSARDVFQKLGSLELQSSHLAKLELRDLGEASRYQSFEESAVATSALSIGKDHREPSTVVSTWKEEYAECNVKYKHEEARIQAWENLQVAKAEAELKKLEVKLERRRSKATEKIMGKLAAARRRANSMRAASATVAEQAKDEEVAMGMGRRMLGSARRNSRLAGGFAVCFARAGPKAETADKR